MLHPQVKALLEALASSGAPTLDKLSIAEARKVYRDRCIGARTETPEVARVEALDASGPNGSIPLRIYRGIGTRRGDRLPVLVYFHGGGWSTGDLETHDGLCRALANTANCAVAAVAYRLAPEYPFPIPFEDALAATRWVHSEADRLLLDRTRMAVGGDSAGGTLAAAVAIAARDSGVRLVFQLLIYPATDHRHEDYPSYHRYANGHLLTRSLVAHFTRCYLADERHQEDWRVSPLLHPDLSGLPPSLVLTAGHDPLHDEGAAYAARLATSGVETSHVCFEGQIHGFILMNRLLHEANTATRLCAGELRRVFSPGL